jgi:hypothetical protein
MFAEKEQNKKDFLSYFIIIREIIPRYKTTIYNFIIIIIVLPKRLNYNTFYHQRRLCFFCIGLALFGWEIEYYNEIKCIEQYLHRNSIEYPNKITKQTKKRLFALRQKIETSSLNSIK